MRSFVMSIKDRETIKSRRLLFKIIDQADLYRWNPKQNLGRYRGKFVFIQTPVETKYQQL